ncbi:MAG: PQQ-binding-like beta-propeller repeat protein [Sedimentisphaerales bacterium]|nr:PQQ-binding-like beta-propeller repeat protein [Sedimentisphaerales bacterium]
MKQREILGSVRNVGMSVCVLVLTLPMCGARSENWPRFRGPYGQGISNAKTIPSQWSEQDFNWKVELPGEGHSSPVVWGARVFVTCAREKEARGFTVCVNALDGREFWRREHNLGKYPKNGLNSYAAATPAVDAERLYVVWPGAAETSLVALTHKGEPVWSIRLPGSRARHGLGGSPIVVGDLVVLAHEQDENNDNVPSMWLAVDGKSGAIRWRYEHPESTQASYSTPCVYRGPGGEAELIFTSNSHGIAALDPATGKLLWKTASALPARVVSSAVLADGTVVATCGRGGRGVRLAAVRPGSDGGSQAAREVYGLDSRIVPYVPTGVAYDGLLFAFHDGGTVSCLRSGTGEVLWSEKPAGRFYGSPVCVNGVLYCITIDGDVVVLQASVSYKLLAVNPLGQKSHATPAVADGRMYLRTLSRLVSIGVGGQ